MVNRISCILVKYYGRRSRHRVPGADQTDKKTPDVSSEIEISSMKKPQKESETKSSESEQFNSFKELFKAIKNHKENGVGRYA